MKDLPRTLAASMLAPLGTMMLAPDAVARADVVCNAECQAQLELQRQNALPRTEFYDAPDPLPWAPAGTLIRQQATADYSIGGAAVEGATRILYHSRTSRGRDVAAAAVVLIPAGTPPEAGWPVVADAHGASGIGRDCAPSLMRDLYHGDQMLRFVAQGYAVVAPDYAGLGTDGKHALGDKAAAAADVVSAFRAARRAGLNLGRRWVLWGHSQGGAAVLAAAEGLRSSPEPGYLGAIVSSPAADLSALTEHLVHQPGFGVFAAFLAAGAKVSDPNIRLDRVLTPQALDRLETTRTGCLGVTSAVYADLTGNALVRPDYLSYRRFARFLTENTTGRKPVTGPLLLLQGDADLVTPRALTDQVAASLCDNGAHLDYRTYPALAHDTIPGIVVGIDDGAMPEMLSWAADRFAGRPSGLSCSPG
jgi:alpha-beta hydrolase superfamily lysophospholipase